MQFGIRAVIAQSFADIFYNNCFQNGVLPIKLPPETVQLLMDDAEKGANARLTIDLAKQTITRPDGSTVSFEIDPVPQALPLERARRYRHHLAEGDGDFRLRGEEPQRRALGLTWRPTASFCFCRATASAPR